jgi:uncharacterized protein (TIGR00290 family)
MERIKTVLNWSSGKDAALAYYLLQQSEEYEVVQLLTTVNHDHDRVMMHGLHETMLDAQVAMMGIDVKKVKLPASPNDEIYKNAMLQALDELKQEGITTAAFGDIFLEDLRHYREHQLEQAGFDAIFPVWQKCQIGMVHTMKEIGLEAVVVCVNEKYLGKEFLGRKVDPDFLQDLPDNVNPCGEHGEFHTYVYNAPYFKAPVKYKQGEIVYKRYDEENVGTNWDKGFYFLDLILDK